MKIRCEDDYKLIKRKKRTEFLNRVPEWVWVTIIIIEIVGFYYVSFFI